MTYSAALPSLRSRPWPNTSNRKLASKTRQEAGSEEQWGPLWSAEERSDLQGKASMSEHRDVRVAQRPARREHRREPRVPDAPGARKWGGFLLGYLFDHSTIQREVTRPSGRNAVALKSNHQRKQRSRAEPAPTDCRSYTRKVRNAGGTQFPAPRSTTAQPNNIRDQKQTQHPRDSADCRTRATPRSTGPRTKSAAPAVAAGGSNRPGRWALRSGTSRR